MLNIVKATVKIGNIRVALKSVLSIAGRDNTEI